MEINLTGVPIEPAHLDNYQKPVPWYKKWWLIVIGVLVILWFGLPYILTPLSEKRLQDQLDRLTTNTNSNQLAGEGLATSDDPVIGFDGAPVVIVEFLDYECPFCREAAPIIKQVMAAYPDAVKLVIRDFPVDSVHPEAINAAVAANCALEQGKFWEYHDTLYSQQDNLGSDLYNSLATTLGLDKIKFNSCLNSLAIRNEISNDFNAGVDAGVRGTPTFFVNNKKVEGPLPFDLWQKIIQSEIDNKFK